MRWLDHGGWGRNSIMLLEPAPSIAHAVESFWIDEWSERQRPSRRFRIVADDAPHIIWHIFRGRHRTESLGVVGARSTYQDLDVSHRLFTVGARLRAGALPVLTGQRAHLLTDRRLILDRRSLRDGRASPERIIDALSEFVGERTARLAPDRFVQSVRLLDPRVNHSVKQVATSLAIHERSLRNLSHAQLGMSLKQFMKIRRLHSALLLARNREPRSWSRIAAECGYADQAHLIRDCNGLLGETPGAFLRRGDE